MLFARDILVILVVAALVSFLVKTFLMRSFYIPSGSMLETLQVDDRILVNELQPKLFAVARGDIVVFTDPGGWLETPTTSATDPVEVLLSLVGLAAPDSDEHLVKRVIGMPGDHVMCCDALGHIVINGIPIREPYLSDTVGPASTQEFDVKVPPDSLWVMGDNRGSSADSRRHIDAPGGGFVPIDAVVGKAVIRTWPLQSFGVLITPEGVFSGVPEPDQASLE